MKQVELSYEAVDSIVVSELKDAIVGLANAPYLEPYADPHLTHLLSTLEYFAGQNEVDELRHENPNLPKPIPEWDMFIEDIIENPDGTAVLQFRAGEKLKEHLIGVGLNKILKEAADHVLSTED